MHDLSAERPLIPAPGAPEQPRCAWRGLMVDSSRTFWPVDVMRELLDLMGRYRFNRLHWHLTDDAGWRFDVPEHPRLVEIGSRLDREPFHWYSNTDPEKRAEAIAAAPSDSTVGWYTDAQIAELIDIAAQRGIEIMPEIDLPGHMGAAIRAYPELGDPSLADLPAAEWPHRNDLLWPSERSARLVRTVVDRVCRLFPFDTVHIGGDECDYAVWEADSALMGRMAAQGLRDGRAIQGWFTDIARDQLRRNHRRAAAWDELVETPVRGDELIFAWRDGQGVRATQASGNDWVYADASRLYLNRLSGPAESEPAGMRPGFGVRSVLDDVDLPEDGALQGIQAAVWTEFIPDRRTLHYYLFPRLLAVAEIAWSGAGVTSWEEFEPRLRSEVAWLESQGVLPRPWDECTEYGQSRTADVPAAVLDGC